jgi:hypothetical protein
VLTIFLRDETDFASDVAAVRKGVVRSHEHPPCSASTRLGNLWGESSKLEFLIGPSAYRLAGGCS